MFDLCSQQCAGTSCSSWLWACWGAPPVRWCCRCRTWWRRQTLWIDGLHPHWSHTGWSDRRSTRRETVGSQITCSRKKKHFINWRVLLAWEKFSYNISFFWQLKTFEVFSHFFATSNSRTHRLTALSFFVTQFHNITHPHFTCRQD